MPADDPLKQDEVKQVLLFIFFWRWQQLLNMAASSVPWLNEITMLSLHDYKISSMFRSFLIVPDSYVSFTYAHISLITACSGSTGNVGEISNNSANYKKQKN